MKILTVIGARPQIIKASALSRAIRTEFSDSMEEVIVHTGQHYDGNMSEVFFSELEIPKPKYNLSVGSGKHGAQTAKMIEGLEQVIETERPDCVVLYGDTNSTLAGAVAASKMLVPICHIEAGLRSFDKTMPEEINRIMCDHASALLFSPTETGYNNLLREGFSSKIHTRASANSPNIYRSGDIMYDNTLFFSHRADAEKYNLLGIGGDFILVTVHRNSNTDNKQRLQSIFLAIEEISNTHTVVLPLHPRTRKMMPLMLEKDLMDRVLTNKNIRICEPVSFLEMIYLEKHSSLVLTDSGGVQKEAFFLRTPCLVLRPTTEWIEIVQSGNAALCDANRELIAGKAKEYLANPPKDYPPFFGDGNTAEFICRTMLETLS